MKNTSQTASERKLPGWALLMPIAWCIGTLAIVWACEEAGYLWDFGVPAGVVSLLFSVMVERAIERKYLKPKADS